MALFRNVLGALDEGINLALTQRKYAPVMKLIKRHMVAEHHFSSDLTKLGRAISSYQKDMGYIYHNLIEMQPPMMDSVKNALNHAKSDLNEVEELLNKLVKEAKLGLE